jgi:hypothetical protein
MQVVADLFPGYFALVMATGIISTGTFLLEMKWLAWMLLAINLIAYHSRSYREPVLFLTLCMFLLGCMLYFDPDHTHLLSFHFRQPHHCNAHPALLD